jgi:hypothetical protein
LQHQLEDWLRELTGPLMSEHFSDFD